ncbi:hypothetical protein BGZ61DRAFT_523502 [Ilyonectria robusta]|uniref:uncharacterized protein n=1 Tax=Ilyonectria robusta TaxID=1079257 RepID=UPI001E8D9916|nr:uncharacterized protein BGZ61DRAFT_523502 [Ilyonectria robusta]KAH8659589.1 hypothetical protein BGZ61DRAFT_523502 [Ilyonectria robusta]
MTPSTQNEGSRLGLRERLNRFRRKSRNPLNDGSIHSPSSTREDADLATNATSLHDAGSTADSLPSNHANDAPPGGSTNPGHDAAQDETDQVALHTDHLDQDFTPDRSTIGHDMHSVASSDLWSAVYREAVDSLGEDIDVAILKGKNVAQLFRELEEIDMEATQESAFLRGVKYLQSIQVPLQTFKLALDLASPLTSLEPTATTVFSVVRSVTAIAISFATADLEFAKQIGEMLEQIAYIAFFGWYKEAQASGNVEPAANIEQLEELLQKVLETIDRPVFSLIDGLDECDRACTILLDLLKTLSQKIPRLKSLLSSRPQEEILRQMDEMARIDLSSDAKRDGIIVEKAVERQLTYLSKNVKALVIETLSRSAQGSAIWSKMIIGLIEVRGIRAPGPMRLFLEELPLPGQLSKLYATLFSQCTSNDPENQELASTALKLLAIARRPLSILELAWAVALGTAQQEVTTVAALADLVDHQRLMSFIHPFIARVDFSDVKKRQVQLIHQSVKEFIIREWTSNRPCLQARPISTATDQARSDAKGIIQATVK